MDELKFNELYVNISNRLQHLLLSRFLDKSNISKYVLLHWFGSFPSRIEQGDSRFASKLTFGIIVESPRSEIFFFVGKMSYMILHHLWLLLFSEPPCMQCTVGWDFQKLFLMIRYIRQYRGVFNYTGHSGLA